MECPRYAMLDYHKVYYPNQQVLEGENKDEDEPPNPQLQTEYLHCLTNCYLYNRGIVYYTFEYKV